MQMMALFVLKTTLKQCENLTIDTLCQKLDINVDEAQKLIEVLHSEHVIQYKYTFKCPKCGEMDTIGEENVSQCCVCNFCGYNINGYEIIKGATIRYILDKDDFFEYMSECYKDELEAAKKGEMPKPKIIYFENTVQSSEEVKVDERQLKLFISHSTIDSKYIEFFVEFLNDIGMSEDNIFCSSINGYGIPWGQDIYDFLSETINNTTLLVMFMLSDNYYASPACLNEMGAAWIQKKEYRSILLPGFEYKKIEGAIDANKIGIKFDDKNLKYGLNEIHKQLKQFFDLPDINNDKWDKIRDKLIGNIERLKSAS